MKPKPSLERINELLVVDVEAGLITWRVGRGRMAAGSQAGRITAYGYHEVNVDSRALFGHQIVWLVANGHWPLLIDHVNGVRSDNRLENLRMGDMASNARNRTNWTHRKLLGAHETPAGTFRASITADGKAYHLGTFATEAEAHQRYVEARVGCAAAELVARQAFLKGLSA